MENATLMDEYGYVKDGKVFLKGYLGNPDRQIGEVKRTEQEAIDYFKNRFNIASGKVEQLEHDVEEAQNKGSYLTKLVQLRKKLLSFDGLGDFIPLLERLDKLETVLEDLIKINQEKNLEIKRALLDETRAVTVIGDDWQGATDLLQEIKSKWIRTGPVDKEYQEEIEGTFQTLLDTFFQQRRDFFSEQNRTIADRIERYTELIAKSDMLVRMYDVEEASRQLRQIRAEWKEVGEIPVKRSAKLYKQFKRSNQRIVDKYNRVKGIVVQTYENPLVTKQREMCREAEQLARSSDIIQASERAKVLLNQWKEIRLPPRVGDKMVAERFRSACDKIFELSYLARVISRKYPAFEIRSPEDQLNIKTREMEWLIKREKADLEVTIASAQNMPPDPEAERQMMGKINIQRRKITMKEKILEEFKAQMK
ncbi:DUF349 domain-containing protein [Runella sp. CRIBMP]|uniref:DUF349 domain-containing protein n=1 Tax=Runella salmonicolor TaxID=2950278 RepID=A0ABT1FLY6_9BACT|nr:MULTISPECIES: DUF349 domain-containing protein [Runella]MCP1382778.1 DUF349 domain-containing protein [Runella salmonicolor]NBB20797.1 DUF349 domain-containing protein [Runella sp. CRIBMP]